MLDPGPTHAADQDDRAGALGGPSSRTAGLASRALAAAWTRGTLPCPSLDPDELTRAAIAAEQHDDFGDGDSWREALGVLTASLKQEAQLSPLGRALAYGLLVKVLRERLRASVLLARHPEIEAIPIRAPIVVLGSMRAGTTRVQRLLARDPRLAHTRGFESLSPVPGRSGQAGRIAKVAVGLTMLRRLNPAIARIHPTSANAPEEEFGFFNLSLVSAQFSTQWHVPSYTAWAARADRADAFRWFRRLLQINAWARGELVPRPWVLKAPEFMDDLGALLAAFPDCRLLCLGRDAQALVPSAASLTWQHRRLHSDHADPATVGAEVLAMTHRRVAAAAEVRRKRPEVPALELAYAAVERDWREAMRRVYAFLGMPFTDRVQRRMAAYLAGARQHRGHIYIGAQFGLSQAVIAAMLPQGA